MSLRAYLDDCKRDKTLSFLPGFEPRQVQLVCSHCTDSTFLAYDCYECGKKCESFQISLLINCFEYKKKELLSISSKMPLSFRLFLI